MQTFLKKSAKRMLAAILVAFITTGLLPVVFETGSVTADSFTEINSIILNNVTMPQAGKTPSTAGITSNGSTAGFRIKQMSWIVKGDSHEYTGTFQAGETYRLYVNFTPVSSAYAFPSNVKNGLTVTINGKEYVSSDSYEPGTACFWGSSTNLNISFYCKVPGEDLAVSFNANGGSGSMSTVMVEENNYLTLPECFFTPPDSGKEFEKWMIGSKYYLPGEKVKITEATTVSAVWTDVRKFTVSYDLSGHGKPIDPVKDIARNSYLSDYLPDVEPYEGWTFEGWYKDPDYQEPVYSTDKVTGDMTLYALLDQAISHIVIEGITLPRAGEMPTVEGIKTNAETAGYTVNNMCWIAQKETHEYVGTYEEGMVYRLFINMTPSSSEHRFPLDVKTNVKATINGKEYVSSDAYEPGTACFWDNGQGFNMSIYFKAYVPGWDEKDGNKYYYDFEEGLVTGWKEIDSSWYLFDDSGVMQTGWVQISGLWYYLDSDGKMLKDWQKIDGSWYYFGGNGVMRTGWQKIGNIWYYFSGSGIMSTGWTKSGDKWYYFESSGAMKTGWLQLGNTWYFLDDGVMVTGWKKINELWYYFEDSGAMATGWKQLSGSWYFFKSNGSMAAGEWCDGYWLNADGTWTYPHKATWRKTNGKWWFGDDTGWYAKSETLTIDGVSYTFDAKGYWIV